MRYFTTLLVFWLAGSLILFFPEQLQKAAGFLLSLALTVIMGIWSIKVLQSATATTTIIIPRLFAFENVKMSIDKLSVFFSLLSNSILTFSYLYQIGYFKNHSHASLKPALHFSALLGLQMVLMSLCMFNHATLLHCWELLILSLSIRMLLQVAGFNWLSSCFSRLPFVTILSE